MARQKRYNGYLRKSFSFNGKRIYVYGKTAQELISNEIQKREELEKGIDSIYNPSLNSYYEHFCSVRRGEIKESTMRTQRCQYQNIANVIMGGGLKFGEMSIKEITRKDIEMARQRLLDEGKTPQNLNNCFAHLNHVFNNATLDDTIVKNPCKALKQLKRDEPPITENRHRALSVEETRKFFECAERRCSYYNNAFLLMIKTGMRIGEVTALFSTDIDRKNGFIHVRRTITRDEVGGYRVGEDAKTKNGVRDIPVTDDILNVIRKQELQNRIFFGDETSGLLFKSVEGKILREYTLNREIARICKEAKIERFTCHAFRDTFATRFIEQRPQDYKVLSEIMGHKDISITLNLYTQVMTENKVNAMNNIMIMTS